MREAIPTTSPENIASGVFPLQQGDLDFLCCLYAAINLLHLHGHADSLDDAGGHFMRVINDLPQDWNIRAFATRGVDPKHVPELLKQVGFRAIGIRPASKVSLPASQPTGVLVFLKAFKGKFDHYTIVTSVSDTGRLALFDSYGEAYADAAGEGFIYKDHLVRIARAWRVELVA